MGRTRELGEWREMERKKGGAGGGDGLETSVLPGADLSPSERREVQGRGVRVRVWTGREECEVVGQGRKGQNGDF